MSQKSTSRVAFALEGYFQLKSRTKGLETNVLLMGLDANVLQMRLEANVLQMGLELPTLSPLEDMNKVTDH